MLSCSFCPVYWRHNSSGFAFFAWQVWKQRAFLGLSLLFKSRWRGGRPFSWWQNRRKKRRRRKRQNRKCLGIARFGSVGWAELVSCVNYPNLRSYSAFLFSDAEKKPIALSKEPIYWENVLYAGNLVFPRTYTVQTLGNLEMISNNLIHLPRTTMYKKTNRASISFQNLKSHDLVLRQIRSPSALCFLGEGLQMF